MDHYPFPPTKYQLPFQSHYAQHHSILEPEPGSHHGATTHHRVPHHTHTPAHHDDNNYVQLYSAITLEGYQLLSLQRPTPRSQLDYTLPVQSSRSTALAEACNVHYHLTTSMHITTNDYNNYIVVRLRVEQGLLFRFLISGQFVQTTRDSISNMLSIEAKHYISTAQFSQCIMKEFTTIYSLKNNYIWDNHMPLLLPNLLHYLYNNDQLHDFQHKAITTILRRSIQHYGFTLLTMTNMTSQQRNRLHRFLRDHNLRIPLPGVDDDQLLGTPKYVTNYFIINYFESRDRRLQMVHNYRTQHWRLHI